MNTSELNVPSMAKAAVQVRCYLNDSHLDADIDETSGMLCEFYRTPDKKDKVGCPCFVFKHSCCVNGAPAEEFYLYVKAFSCSRTIVVKMQKAKTCVAEEIPAGSNLAFASRNWYYDGISLSEDV